jgi:hypothetical protein
MGYALVISSPFLAVFSFHSIAGVEVHLPFLPSPCHAFSSDHYRTCFTTAFLQKMRVFLIQKAIGLFASSGEYRANMSFLRHLASLGNATAQLCFALDGEVATCIAEVEAAGKTADLTTTAVHLRSESGESSHLEVSVFTNIDGIHTIALDGTRFKEMLPQDLYTDHTIDFIEVRGYDE